MLLADLSRRSNRCMVLFQSYFFQKKIFFFILSSFAFGYFFLFILNAFHQTLLNTVAFVLVNGILLFLNYSVTIHQLILHVTFLTSTMIFTEMIWLWGLHSFGFGFTENANNASLVIAIATPSKLLYWLIILVCCQIFKSESLEYTSYRQVSTLFALPLLSIGASYLASYIGFSVPESAPVRNLLLIIVCVLLIVNLLFIALYHQMQRINAQHLQLQLSLQQEQADLVYYQALQKQSENQRILIHDIKNHLQSVHGLAQTTGDHAVVSYIETILSDMVHNQPIRLCTDPILNSILLKTQEQCKTKQIDFQCDVREDCLASMDASSITTLYGNLLSNAMEAAEQSANPFIELSVTKRIEQQQIVISIINSCDDSPIPDGIGGFISHKKDKLVHGLGLKSIQRIVKRYHGASTAYYDLQEKQFHHILRFPL